MRRPKNILLIVALLTSSFSVMSQDYFDDVYYNPKKSGNNSGYSTQTKQSAYISNMADMDVDTYNRRGQYYTSAVDTIGMYVENGEDFVYTQQIQKFYNPTIVVDNASVLGDVLANAYGNVEIVIDANGLPVFSPWYGYYGWNWPYYSSVWSPWSWGISFGGWGWNIGYYNPWYSWAWGPSWSWGPGWGGPGWGPGWHRPHPAPPMATWRPHGNRPVGPAPGWSGGGRPGGNYNMNHGAPMSTPRPGQGAVGSSRPQAPGGSRPAGVINNNGRWQYNTTGQTGHRQPGTGVVATGRQNQPTSPQRVTGSNTGSSSRTKNTSTKVTTPNTNQRKSTTTSSPSRSNSNSRVNTQSPSRSTGGSHSTGGGSRGGGGGSRGRHR